MKYKSGALADYISMLKFTDKHKDTKLRYGANDIVLDLAFKEYLFNEGGGFESCSTRDLAVVVWSLFYVDVGNDDRWATVEEIEALIAPFCDAVMENKLNKVSDWLDEMEKKPLPKEIEEEIRKDEVRFVWDE